MNEAQINETLVPEDPRISKPSKWIWWVMGGCAVLSCCCCLILIIVLVVALAPVAGETFSSIGSQIEPTMEIPTNTFVPIEPVKIQSVVIPDFMDYPNQVDNALGDPSAPVVIIEYSDFQCPYCRNFWQDSEHQIIDEYVRSGKVYFVYRSMGNFLGDFGGTTESQDAALAAYCSGDEGRFWEYHDLLFANWNGENQGNNSLDRLVDFAKVINLDEHEFRDCLESQQYLDRVMQDAQDGEAAGVSGTPSFVINGQLLEGAQPFEVFKEAIEKALANQ
jgi:protein-disulfide isomerase